MKARATARHTERGDSRDGIGRDGEEIADDAAERGRARATDLRSYATGLVLALSLTAAAFALVAFPGAGRGVALWGIGALALVQIVVHFRCFLHIDLSEQKREDLQLILFSTLLLIMMGGGTLWIMFTLYGRMAPGTMPTSG